MECFHLMMKYQKMNNIKGSCITNAQYLYDQLNPLHKVKARAVMVINEEKSLLCHSHLVLEYEDGSFVDPSYEFNHLRGNKYIKTLKHLDFGGMDPTTKKMMMSSFIQFIKYADTINQGKCLVHDKKYYDSQADYVDQMLRGNGVMKSAV